MNYQRQMTVS